MTQADREPLRTYEDAINRLSFWAATEKHTHEQLELAVRVVADVFWFSDEKVRLDLQRANRSLDRVAPRRRRAVSVGSSGVWGH